MRPILAAARFVLSLALAGAAAPVWSQATTVIENPQPGATLSGIGLISGWSCAARNIEVSFDGASTRQRVPTGGARADTQGICGRSDTGFGLLFNYNVLGAGQHSLQVWVDGVPFGAPIGFNVVTLGGEFVAGAAASFDLPNFPTPGRTARIEWRESLQNFAITGVTVATPTDGALDTYPFDFNVVRVQSMSFAQSTPDCRVSLRYTNRTTQFVIPTLVFDVVEGGGAITGTVTFGRRRVNPGVVVDETQSVYTNRYLRCNEFGLRFNGVQSLLLFQ